MIYVGDIVEVLDSYGNPTQGKVTGVHHNLGITYYDVEDNGGNIITRKASDVQPLAPQHTSFNFGFGNYPWDDYDIEVTSEDPVACWHVFEHYVGFTEEYDFCTKCGKKSGK